MTALVRALSASRGFATSLSSRRSTLLGVDKREVSYPIAGKKAEVTDLKDAFKAIRSGDNIYIHGMSGTPTPLLNGLVEHAKGSGLKNITLHHLIVDGVVPWDNEECRGIIRSNCLFTGGSLRKAVNSGRADFNSVFLSDIPLLFRRGVIKLNAALILVSPPDANGYCTFGAGLDLTRSAVTNADLIIALVSKNVPRTLGDTVIHSSHIDVMVRDDSHHPYELPASKPSAEEQKVGEIIAENLVDDGATIQMGIGGIPDAALGGLKNHKDIGVHTEMFSDGVLELLENNVITNRRKKVHPGKIVTTFAYGSKNLYKFLGNNPLIEFGDAHWVNDPAVIRQNPKVTAINAAIEVDLTGQVVSDSIGKKFFSGNGGQVDFIRGAALSNDGLGKPIIAVTSTTRKGESKIVPFIREGSGVTTSRAHVHYIVTEYGIAQLWGRNMRQRAFELIQIAHPDHRESLERSAFDRLKVMPSPH